MSRLYVARQRLKLSLGPYLELDDRKENPGGDGRDAVEHQR